MNVLLTGASGLVGSALVSHLLAQGDRVDVLVRGPKPGNTPSGGTTILWNPAKGELDPVKLEGYDAIIHLAGENIAEGRWTDAKMARIRDSRVDGTSLLARAIARLDRKPLVFISASAIGFYGDRGDEILTEQSHAGTGFLADVCQAWEDACAPAVDAGVRVAHVRIGVVLAKAGGALGKMLLPFQLGLGGRIGSGKQWMSCIALHDLVGAIRHVMLDESIEGKVNAVSPEPLTNAAYTKALGSALRRPTIFPLPAFAARLVLGKMADGLLLASTRVEPEVLTRTGYKYEHPTIQSALQAALGS